MNQNGFTNFFLRTSLLAFLFAVSACASKTTPPGADIIFGSLVAPDGFAGSYTLLQWKEGLSISIIDDSQGAHESSASGSTDDPVWMAQGSIRGKNSEGVLWRVETTDGKTAQLFMNGRSYDLALGTLFLLKTNNKSPEVLQLQSGHTGTCTDDKSCQQLLMQDPAVLKFMHETQEQAAMPESEPAPTMPSPMATVEALSQPGWMTHTSQQCEYSIRYPAEMQVQSQTPYSDLLMFNLSDPDEGARNFVYVSVITPDIKHIAERGVYNHDVYNYDPMATETLLSMQVGESTSVHSSLTVASGFTYQRQPDSTVGGHPARMYENLRPWEFPEGTKETRYYISLDECTYLIGGYMDTAESNLPGVVTEELFKKIVASVQLIP